MEHIKFRVHDKDTGKILAYEIFNTNLNWGYYWLDAKELEKYGGEAICHAPSEYFKHPNFVGQLIRVLYSGMNDNSNKEIYDGDILMIKGGDRKWLFIVEKGAKYFYQQGRFNGFYIPQKCAVVGNKFEDFETYKKIRNSKGHQNSLYEYLKGEYVNAIRYKPEVEDERKKG